MTTLTLLLIDKTALANTRISSSPLPPLHSGEVLLKLGRAALTTNNITYAAFGDAMQYWNFFPTGEEEWGQMPVWGFADVVVSDVEGVQVGERFYGYWPLASHLVLRPVRVSERGFYDGAKHRQSLTSAYNQYTRTSTDPAYHTASENYQMLVRPLFITSFMLGDFLQDNAFFGAQRLVVSSASSKTAYGTAFCLVDYPQIDLVGLTSSGNRAFVEKLGCYQRTLSYGELETLDARVPTLYVDFSGDEALRTRVHNHCGKALTYDCYAGSAQNPNFLRDTGLPGPQPQIYFAPVQIRKRNADWGPALVNQKFNAAQRAFIEWLDDPHTPRMQIQQHSGLSTAQTLIADLCAGRIDPQQGHVVVLD